SAHRRRPGRSARGGGGTPRAARRSRIVMTRIRQEWELLQVGETFGPYRYEVRGDVVDALRAAIGDEELEYDDGERIAPAMLLTFPFLQMIEAKYEPPPGVIHAEQEFDLRAPVRVGSVLTCTGAITAKF